jgi:hypothetical protein
MRYTSLWHALRSPRPERSMQRRASTAPPQRALVGWLAALIMIGLLPALLLPLLMAEAATEPAALILDPVAGPPGSTITVTGANFAPGVHGQLRLGRESGGIPRFQADMSGRFSLSLTIPETAPLGAHELQATTAPHRQKGSSTVSVFASATFTVEAAPTAAGPVPTPTPTPGQNLAPTPTPTATSNSTPTPETARVPTPAPTPVPTPKPNPTPTPKPKPKPTPTPPPQTGSVTLVGAGDIADCSSSGDEATAALLEQIAGTIFTAGDNAYESGTAAQFRDCYGPSWGKYKARTRPAPGNHEWITSNAQGYRDYFGISSTYYAYDLGSWRVVVLDSNCSTLGGCGPGSPQYTWLGNDLAANARACTVAIWHIPLFSSGEHGNNPAMQAIWQLLYDRNADLVLNAHDHTYERFAPQTPAGARDDARGLRQFVVGTGGKSLYAFTGAKPNSEVRNNNAFGVLKLNLRSGGYDWRFVPVAGKTFSDTGSGTCH